MVGLRSMGIVSLPSIRRTARRGRLDGGVRSTYFSVQTPGGTSEPLYRAKPTIPFGPSVRTSGPAPSAPPTGAIGVQSDPFALSHDAW